MTPAHLARATHARYAGLWLLTAKLVVVAVAAVVLLANPRVALGATGLGGLLPTWAALIWVATVLALCLFGIVALGLHRLKWASTALALLALLVAGNGAVSVGVNGLGSSWASGLYAVGALAFFDRSRALDRFGDLALRLPADRGER
jgi:L-asparagine transporter-like permease